MHGRPLNLLGCVKPIHKLSKWLLKSIIYVLMSFRPNLLLTLQMPSSCIAIRPSHTSNKSALSPKLFSARCVCSCSSAEGGEGYEEGCGWRIGGELRLSALGARDVGRKQGSNHTGVIFRRKIEGWWRCCDRKGHLPLCTVSLISAFSHWIIGFGRLRCCIWGRKARLCLVVNLEQTFRVLPFLFFAAGHLIWSISCPICRWL